MKTVKDQDKRRPVNEADHNLNPHNQAMIRKRRKINRKKETNQNKNKNKKRKVNNRSPNKSC